MTDPRQERAGENSLPDAVARFLMRIATRVAAASVRSGEPAEVDVVLRRRPLDGAGREGCWAEIRPAESPADAFLRDEAARRLRELNGFLRHAREFEPPTGVTLERVRVIPVLSGGWKLTVAARWTDDA